MITAIYLTALLALAYYAVKPWVQVWLLEIQLQQFEQKWAEQFPDECIECATKRSCPEYTIPPHRCVEKLNQLR